MNPGYSGSVCVVDDGEVVFFSEEEKQTRFKYDANPFKSLTLALEKYKDIDYMVLGGFDDSQYPQLTFTSENLFSGFVRKFNPKIKIVNMATSHFLGHAASAFYNSGFDKALSIVIDNHGSMKGFRRGTKGYYGFESEIVSEMSYPGKSKILHSSLTTQETNEEPFYDEEISASFEASIVKAWEGAAASLGIPVFNFNKIVELSTYYEEDEEIIPELFNEHNRCDYDLVYPNNPAGAALRDDTSIGEPFTSLRTDPKIWHFDRDEMPLIVPEIAHYLQIETEKIVIDMIREWVEKTEINNVCLSGMMFSNPKLKMAIEEACKDLNIFIDPIANDKSTSIGLAKLVYHRESRSKKINTMNDMCMHGVEPDYSEINNHKVEDCGLQDVVNLLQYNNEVAIYQGKSEIDCFSLGNRTVLKNIKAKKDEKIRWFFKPTLSILKENVSNWFDFDNEHLNLDHRLLKVKENKKDDLKDFMHGDGTCTVQIINDKSNLYEIMKMSSDNEMEILINDEFKDKADVTAETLEDAINTFESSDIDVLYFPELKKMMKKDEA